MCRILGFAEGESLLAQTGMLPIEEIRQLAGGSEPPAGLMGKIRGSVALDTAEKRHAAVFEDS